MRYARVIFGIVAIGAWSAQTWAAEDKLPLGWTQTLTAGVNLNQTLFDNWSQGGEDTLNWAVNTQGQFTLVQPVSRWIFSGKLVYGQTQQGNAEPEKSEDELRLEGVYAYALTSLVQPYGALRIESQFAPGYEVQDGRKVAVSNFFDPGFVTESAGFRLSPSAVFATRLGFALKETVARIYTARYTDDPATEPVEELKLEPGLEWVSNLQWPMWGTLLLTSELNTFSDLEGIDRVTVRWDNTLAAAVAPYVTATASLQIYYNRAFSTRRQLKQGLSLGVTYSFL